MHARDPTVRNEAILTPDGARIVDAHGRESRVTSAGMGPSVGKYLMLAYLPLDAREIARHLRGCRRIYMNEAFPGDGGHESRPVRSREPPDADAGVRAVGRCRRQEALRSSSLQDRSGDRADPKGSIGGPARPPGVVEVLPRRESGGSARAPIDGPDGQQESRRESRRARRSRRRTRSGSSASAKFKSASGRGEVAPRSQFAQDLDRIRRPIVDHPIHLHVASNHVKRFKIDRNPGCAAMKTGGARRRPNLGCRPPA